MSDDNLETAYKYCERVTRDHAKSFYFAAKFLPRFKQKAVFAVYALCRHVDDEIDEAGFQSEQEAADAVEDWRRRLDLVYDGEYAGTTPGYQEGMADHIRHQALSNVFTAWKDLLGTYPIPRQIPLDLIKGVLMDTYKKRYSTFDELYVYCYHVASTVGLMSSEILGYSDRKALGYAEALGVAMQLTNILRDVKEDARLGRIYLPAEDLDRFDVSEEQIFDGVADDRFRALLRYEIGRARRYYSEGEKGVAFLDNDTRFTVLFAARIYARILDEIEAQSYDVFASRAHTSRRQKILAMPAIWLESRRLKSGAE